MKVFKLFILNGIILNLYKLYIEKLFFKFILIN